MKREKRIKELVLIAILGAMSMLLMMVRFPLPFMPSFMSFDFAAVPEIIGGFLMGPVAALFIILIKTLLMIITMGSNSMFVGEIQSVILSSAFVLPATIIYSKYKSRKSAVVGLCLSTVVLTFVSIISNLYFILPFYANLYSLKIDDIISAAHLLNPLITNEFTLVIFGIVPFNLLKGIINSAIIILIYKKLSVLFERYTTI